MVLGIAGSPRRHGNSEQLLDACLSGAREAGASVEKLVVRDHPIAPCMGCNACSLSGHCILDDGMSDVYPLLDAADAIVVSTPVFFATVPAGLKALYDRCQPYWARRYVLKEEPRPKRPGALLVVGGGGDPFGAQCAITTTRSVFAVLRVRYEHELAVIGVDSPTDMGRHPQEFRRAEEIGRALAEAVSAASAGS